MTKEFNRRQFLKLASGAGGFIIAKHLGMDLFPLRTPEVELVPESISVVVPTHEQFLTMMREKVAGKEKFINDFRELMLQTAGNCVISQNQLENKQDWVIPSLAYENYLFPRDSFWILAALKDKDLSRTVVDKLQKDQIPNDNGQIATALVRDGSRPPNRDRDDESTIFYILHNYLLKQLGGEVDKTSLEKAYNFISSHVSGGKYLTFGERRQGEFFDGINQIGTYHYWADTYRPAGRPEATPENFAYNQGLYCVALNCFKNLGISIDPRVVQEAESVYSKMVNPMDGISLPQREGSTAMDVSALAGEALSFYFFDKPLLSREKVSATVENLSQVYYPDGEFLGFRSISGFYGSYRPDEEFIVPESNTPGNYQNGGSWLLYDALTLYAAGRHGITLATRNGICDPESLFVQRISSEVKNSWASHEFINTNPESAGWTESFRDGYGWNSFVANLLPKS